LVPPFFGHFFLFGQIYRVGRCVYQTPKTLMKCIFGPGLTEEEQNEKDSDHAKISIQNILHSKYSKRLENTSVTLTLDSKEIILTNEEWKNISVIDNTGLQRTPQRRDRLRFQIGYHLLGKEDYEHYEYSIDEISTTNPYAVLLTKPIESEELEELIVMAKETGDYESNGIRVWWCPPITDAEIKERFDTKKRNDMKRIKEKEKERKKKMRVSRMAERLGEDSVIGKRMLKAAGIVVEEDDEEEEEEVEEEVETKSVDSDSD
jgi:hypothetical protein